MGSNYKKELEALATYDNLPDFLGGNVKSDGTNKLPWSEYSDWVFNQKKFIYNESVNLSDPLAIAKSIEQDFEMKKNYRINKLEVQEINISQNLCKLENAKTQPSSA